MHGLLRYSMLALALAGAACNGKSGGATGPEETAAQGQADDSAGMKAEISAQARAADEAAVRKVFDDYKSAIMKRRGTDAVALVDSNTLDFYKKCRALALTASKDALLAENVFVRMTALVLRVRVPADQLEAMDAHKVVVHAVDQGWVGDVGDLGIGEISIAGDRATGKSQVPNAPDQVVFEFRRQDGAWKIDLTAIFGYADQALRHRFAQMAMDENQAILELISMVSGSPVTEDIWNPPRQ